MDVQERAALFDALSTLERRALIGGASDRVLREIAEARFLTGILREAVQPTRPTTLRTVLRVRGRATSKPRSLAEARSGEA